MCIIILYVFFSAKHQNAENLFQIEPNSGIITLTNAIPPSIPSYVLNITAYDDGSCCGGYPRLSSSSFVIIMIMDINNNNPTFPSCTYAPSVLENQPPGTRVVDVSTIDQRKRTVRDDVLMLLSHLMHSKLGEDSLCVYSYTFV